MPLSVRACAIRSSFQCLATQTLILKVNLSEMETLKTWRSKQTHMLISIVIHIYVSGFGIFTIVCNDPICALASSLFLNLNLISGKQVILAQKHTSLKTTV